MSCEEIALLRVAIGFYWLLFIAFGVPQHMWLVWRLWFKRGYITGFFYEWKGTKKAHVWYAVWMSLFAIINLIPVAVMFEDIFIELDLFATLKCSLILLVIDIVYASIYLIIKHQLRAYYDRKEEREEAEEERKRAEEREARRKAQTEEKPHNDSSAPPDSPDEHDADGPNGEEK